MNKVFFHQLCVSAILGVYEIEREFPQRLYIDVEMRGINVDKAAQSDDLVDCNIDYAVLRQHIINFAEESSFQLIETFSDRLIKSLFEHFEVDSIVLRVAKADVFDDIKCCGLEIERNRADVE